MVTLQEFTVIRQFKVVTKIGRCIKYQAKQLHAQQTRTSARIIIGGLYGGWVTTKDCHPRLYG